MERDSRNVSPDEKPSVSAELCRLLVEQIALARKGDFGGVEQLAVQAESLVAEMTQEGLAATDGVQRHNWERLYGELAVILRAEHVDVKRRLKQVRRVKRVIGAYGGKTGPHSRTHRPVASSES